MKENNYAVGIYDGEYGFAATAVFDQGLTREEAEAKVEKLNKKVPDGVDIFYYLIDPDHYTIQSNIQ